MAHSEYDLIKKNNGEVFARALRDANLLELPNIVELVRYAGRTLQSIWLKIRQKISRTR